MKTYYIGRFSPNTGGISKKNNAIFSFLNKKEKIIKIDLSFFKYRPLTTTVRLVLSAVRKNKLIIGISTVNKRNWLLFYFLNFINYKSLSNTSFFVMGGNFITSLNGNKRRQAMLKKMKCIFVETDDMRKQLTFLGVDNVEVVPNCRQKPSFKVVPIDNSNSRLRCLIFSLICKEKGIDLILKTASQMKNVEFCFYGEIKDSFKEDFYKEIKSLDNCAYCGVFDGSYDDLYHLMNEYDVFLFPTIYENEGISGSLLESRISGVASIVSDWRFNSSVVRHNIDGYVMENYSVPCLKKHIEDLNSDRKKLFSFKLNCVQSSATDFYDYYESTMIKAL